MLIKATNLTKKYGTKLALNHATIKIDQGQLIAYLGTNGAGKSTTINLLTGLMNPTSGIITRRQGIKIGIVFQDSILDKELSVKDNLYFRSKLYHEVRSEWMHQLIQLMRLNNFLNQRYGTLSGGQRRRVDITRALIIKPDILFLDEPTTGLDLQNTFDDLEPAPKASKRIWPNHLSNYSLPRRSRKCRSNVHFRKWQNSNFRFRG